MLINKGVKIIGSGSYTPPQILDNKDLSQMVDTSDEWINARTGMRKRHIASHNESLSKISAKASLKAISSAGLTPEDIHLIILATSTPDDLFGSACKVQNLIGASNAVAFDLTAACSGFVFSLVTAAQFIRTGVYNNILIIGADILSRWVDWEDRSTCVLFGDGAGAIVCQATEEGDRLLGFEMFSDGKKHECLNIAYQGDSQNLIHDKNISQGGFTKITMQGKEVYRFAVSKVPEVIQKALFRANLTTDDIDWLILHQANQRIIDAIAQRLKIPTWKVIVNISEYGNTSAASIPIALDESVKKGKIRVNDTIVTAGFGAGLTWGSAIFKYGG